MSEAPKRWFKFSLSTLFLVVTAIALLLGREVRLVRARDAALDRVGDAGGWLQINLMPGGQPEIPSRRRWLGDEPVYGIGVPPDFPEIDRLRRLFPESKIYVDEDLRGRVR